MEYISSDTNVWIDLKSINRMDLPFLLPYTYVMYAESIKSELLNPIGFRDELLSAGLKAVDLTTEEFNLAYSWEMMYPKLTVQDRIALSIAHERQIILLTGDNALRSAAQKERVKILSTIGILDRSFNGKYIPRSVYQDRLTSLLDQRGRRLPRSELKRRPDSLND